MDINNLRAFIEVADKKSFSRTAESLKLSQPAVSKRIAALETELSAKLFDRVGRSVHLTEAGRVLLPSARQIHLELSRIENVICSMGSEVTGSLRIGTSEQIGTSHLPEALRTFRSNYPKVEIDLQFDSVKPTLAALEGGLLEIAACALPNRVSLSSKLHRLDIWSSDMVVVTAVDHPLTTDDTVSLQLLTKCPAILPSAETATRREIDDILRNADVKANVSIEANDFDTMKTMASIGLGWACIPAYLVSDSLAVIPVDELALKHTVSVIHHNERTLSRAAQAFVDVVSG